MATYADIWSTSFGGRDDYLAVISLINAERRLRKRIVALLEKHSLPVSHWTVLTMVHLASLQGEQLTIGLIAGALDVHSTTITNALDKLEPQGWVERVDLDRRTIGVRMTKAGADRLIKIQQELVDDRLGLNGIKPQDVVKIWQALAPLM